MKHRRRQVYLESSAGGFELTAIGDARITGRLGEGVSSVVYSAMWRGREVALKVYKHGSVERHARLLGQELAVYEYERNLAFYRAPGMARHVAEPLAYMSSGGVSALVQEKLEGTLYYHFYKRHHGRVPESLWHQVEEIVRLSHAAGLYDVDLHSLNIMVTHDGEGRPLAKLFDFNLIPFYVHPPNPFVWLLVKTGRIGMRSRDLRKLRRFHDFRRADKKIRMFAGQGA